MIDSRSTQVTLAQVFLFLSLTLVSWCGAYADADPSATDWLPTFRKVGFEGHDVVFYSPVTELRLPEGQLDSAISTPLDNLQERTWNTQQQVPPCSIPDSVVSKFSNTFGPAEIVLCELPGKIWFASIGYCGEGEDDPDLNQGILYSYNPDTGAVDQYLNVIPRCAGLSGLVRAGSMYVAATYYQGEYGLGSGGVFLLDLDRSKKIVREIPKPKQMGAVLAISPYESNCDCVWLAAEYGVERLTLGGGTWDQRYFDYLITDNNRLTISLSRLKPSDERMWLGRLLNNTPIEDLRGFVNAWYLSSAQQSAEYPRTGPLLLPYYLAAFERTKSWKEDWHYSSLLSIIISHYRGNNPAKMLELITAELSQINTLSRRGEVYSIAKRSKVYLPQALTNEYFDDLLVDYFSRYEGNSSNKNDVVRIAFENPEFLPKLQGYYLTHPITYRVEETFLERMKQYASWPVYTTSTSQMVSTRLKRLKLQFQMMEMCTKAVFFSQDRSDQQLIAILEARLATDTQAKFTIAQKSNPAVGSIEDSCIHSSERWLAAPDEVRPQRVSQLLDVSERNSKFKPLVLDILNAWYKTGAPTLDEWKRLCIQSAGVLNGFACGARIIKN